MHKEVQQATSSPTSLGVTASTIVISESALGHEALVDFTVEADLGKSAPNDSLSQQQGIDKGTKIYSFDHIITGTNPNVLVDKTKSSRDGLETIHTETGTDKEASKVEKEVSFDQYEFDTSLELTSFEDAKEIKMEDLSKLVKDARINLMDLDSLEDDTPFIVEDDEDEESQNLKLEKENANAKAKVAFLSAQPSYPNVEQLTTLLVKSLKPELTKLLTYHDFSASLSKELKELPSKFSDISGEIKDLKRYVEGLEIEILSELKTIPKKLEEFQSTISGQVSSIPAQLSKLKTLDALPSLLNKVTEALNRFAQAVESVSQKASDPSVPSIGQAGPHKGKNVMSPKDAEEKETESDSKTEVRLSGSMVESSKKKHLKKFDFITEQGENIHLTEEQIKEQKRIEESVKADLAKKEVELGREELVDLLGINVVTSTYKSKLKYDKYCDKMLNRRALGKITNYDVLSKGKGPITLKVFREDGSDETI
ncbi:hypothetical protein Tco_1396962 [Tanacetum coccineum]